MNPYVKTFVATIATVVLLSIVSVGITTIITPNATIEQKAMGISETIAVFTLSTVYFDKFKEAK